jgi:hypothetical protein
VLGVNVTGPYHQFQDWPIVARDISAIKTWTATTVDASNFTAQKYNLPPTTGWAENSKPPLKPTCSAHTRTTAATDVSPELLARSWSVPQWAKFGVSDFRFGDVIMQKQNLTWDVFERSLHPYWKVGNMMAIWKKIYDLLWPLPAERRWGLTHAKLINVLREMIDAVPVDKDGAPEKSLVITARERYHSSLTSFA